jgi:hypothetical protein
MELKEILKNKRKKLSENSLKTYVSILSNIYKNVFGEGEMDMENFNKYDDIMKYLEDKGLSTRKTSLSALYVLTDDKRYKKEMLKDIRKYDKEQNTREMSDKMKESWIESIDKEYDKLEKEFKLLSSQEKHTIDELQRMQNFIILLVLGGVYIPPRRSKDYTEFKVKNIDEKKDNYMDKNKFIFNTYKTSKSYGKQSIDIPIKMKNYLLKWISLNPTDFLLFDKNNNKLNNVKLNQRLNKILGDGKAVNSLRHMYLTKHLGQYADQNDTAKEKFKMMGSSMRQLNVYVKKTNQL